MKDEIKVSIISDVVCPWCIIGYKRLEKAVNEMGLEDQVEVEWQPFEINPDLPAAGEELTAHSARKYGSTPEDSQNFRNQMTELGAELGFKFDFFKGMKIVNTQDAHILLEYAKEKGLQTDLKLRLFSACFSEHKDISDRGVLAEELQCVGLNPDEALEKLDNADARSHVQMQESYWYNQGVSGVPTMIFNDVKALSGAQPVEVYKELLGDLIAE